MSETPKSTEIKKEVPKPHGVELPHVQEARKLDAAAKQVQVVKRKQEIAQGNKLHAGEKEDAGKALLEGFTSEPGKLDISQKPKENFVENSDVKDVRELNMAKKSYQEQLKKTYETHIGELQDKPEEQKKIGQEYLGRCVKDLGISSDKPAKNDVRILAETLPKAWKETLLDPKSVEKNSELKKVREAILEQTMKNASRIIPLVGESPEMYQERLYQNLKNTTGVNITLEEFKVFTKQNYTEQLEQTQKTAEDIVYDGNGNTTGFKPGVERGGRPQGLSGGSSNTLPPPGGWSESSGSEVGSSPTNELLGLLGGSRESVEKNLVSVPFLGRLVSLHRVLVPILQKVEAEIKADPEASKYVVRDLGGFNWRTKRGGSSLSNHALGIAMDINADQNMGSFGDGGRDIPTSFIDIMKNNGFVWGGDWKSPYDPMHFEYSNGALLKSALGGGSSIV